MIPKIIHQTSRTKDLRPEEKRLLAKARRILPGWQFRLWDDADNLDLMKQAFPQYVDAYELINRGVIKADIARCVYLYVYGGVYIDTDYKVIRAFDDAVLSMPCVLPISREDAVDGYRLGNAVMASVAGHGFWPRFLEGVFSHDMRAVKEDNVIELTGPDAITAFYLAHRSEFPDIVTPARILFHPRVTSGGLKVDTSRDTYGIHLTWGSWRSKSPLMRWKNRTIRLLTSV